MLDKKPRRTRSGSRHDPDNPDWTDRDFERARPASQVIGKAAAAALVKKRGRPKMEPAMRKQQVTLRLSPDVLGAVRATGDGWQGRVDKVLRRAFVDYDRAVQKALGEG